MVSTSLHQPLLLLLFSPPNPNPNPSPFLLNLRPSNAPLRLVARASGVSAGISIGAARVSPVLRTLAANPTLVSGMAAFFVAQSMKLFLNFFVERRWDLQMLCTSGGMPSSHSALCTGITTAVAICHGVGDTLFAVCLGFSLIVMYDAIGVRRHAGLQAEVLNKIVEDLFQGHPISQRKLKVLLGHTPSQVIAGALLGIFVAFVCCRSMLAI